MEFTSKDRIKKAVVKTYVKQAIAVEKAGLNVDFKAKRELELPKELTQIPQSQKRDWLPDSGTSTRTERIAAALIRIQKQRLTTIWAIGMEVAPFTHNARSRSGWGACATPPFRSSRASIRRACVTYTSI